MFQRCGAGPYFRVTIRMGCLLRRFRLNPASRAMSGYEPAIRQFQIWTEFWRITGGSLPSRLRAINLESVFGSYVFDHSENACHTLWRTKSIHPEFCSTGILREFASEGSQFRSCVLAVNGRLHLLSKKADAQIDRRTPMPTLHIVPLLPKGQIL